MSAKNTWSVALISTVSMELVQMGRYNLFQFKSDDYIKRLILYAI
jgi:hypothetical protein